jgi:hypothetical protein
LFAPRELLPQRELAMLTLFYVFTISLVGASLFQAVNRVEPNRRLALILKLWLITLGAAAILHKVLPLFGKGF